MAEQLAGRCQTQCWWNTEDLVTSLNSMGFISYTFFLYVVMLVKFFNKITFIFVNKELFYRSNLNLHNL